MSSTLHSSRILIWPLLLALGLLGGYTARELAAVAGGAVRAQAQALARNVAISSTNLILTGSLDELEALLLRSAEFSEVQSLQVIAPNGRTLSFIERQPGEPPRVVFGKPGDAQALPSELGPQTLTVGRGDELLVWHPVEAGGLKAWVRLSYRDEALQGLQHRIWRNTAVVAVLAVSVSALAMMLFLRRPVGALDRARRFAIALPQSRGEVLPAEKGPIEVTELSMALNEASCLLRQQFLVIEEAMRHVQLKELKLSEQNDQLGGIFALSPDGLVTFNQHGVVQFANQAFLDLTGLSREAVSGLHELDLQAHLMELASTGSTFSHIDACFEPPAGEHLAEREQLLVREAGGRRVLSLKGQRGDAGSVSKVLYVCDVTRQHTLDAMKSEFLSMAAHELRTPMVSIFGFTELMLKREMSAETRQDLLGRIYRHSQSMVSILNELLDLARIESRRGQDFKIVDAELVEVVSEVVTDFKPPEGREPPVVTLPAVPMPVQVDRHKMQQAVLNILSNAYKYSPDGGEVALRYLVAADGPPGRRFGVSVQDHGLGLSPENLARMGERFFRTDKSGNIPGTGLGVSIVKELLDLMGGHVDITSELGKGTTVTMWL
jgi:two-component system sensor histidine kinase VicK